VLVALKVNDPIKTFVTSAPAAAGDYTTIIPTFGTVN
jgi:hypothetical protein